MTRNTHSRKTTRFAKAAVLLTIMIIMVLSSTVSAFATEVFDIGASGPALTGRADFMMEANTGTVLVNHNGDERMNPASTTKILTGLLVIENCENLQDVITYSWNSVNNISWDSSKVGAEEGEQMTVEQCLYGLFMKSGNDAAMALAEYVSGSVEAFAELMNQRAAELGCTGSHFSNPHGLTADDHYTTAHDLCLILQEGIKHPEFIQYASANYYHIDSTNKHPDGFTWYTQNRFLNDGYSTYDSRVIASKTGFTDEAGNCLVTAVRDGDMILVMAAMGCEGTHYDDSVAMRDYGLNNFAVHNMSDAGSGATFTYSNSRMFGSWRNVVDASDLSVEATTAYVILPKTTDVNDVVTELTLDTENYSDNVIGHLVYKWNDRTVGQSDLIVTSQRIDLNENVDHSANVESETETAAAGQSDGGRGINKLLLLLIIIIVIVIVVVVLVMMKRNEDRGGRPGGRRPERRTPGGRHAKREPESRRRRPEPFWGEKHAERVRRENMKKRRRGGRGGVRVNGGIESPFDNEDMTYGYETERRQARPAARRRPSSEGQAARQARSTQRPSAEQRQMRRPSSGQSQVRRPSTDQGQMRRPSSGQGQVRRPSSEQTARQSRPVMTDRNGNPIGNSGAARREQMLRERERRSNSGAGSSETGRINRVRRYEEDE